MFQTLIESKAHCRPQWGGSVVSAVGHATIVSALIVLTAQANEPARRTVEDRVIFTPPRAPAPNPPAAPRVATGAPSSSTPAVLGTPPLVLRVEIPVGVPPVDLGMQAVTQEDTWTVGPRGSRVDGLPGGTGTGPANATDVFREEQVDKPVFLAPGSTAPRYPDGLRAAGISGSVMVEFVVDTAGRVEPGSIQLSQADHALFASAVRDVLPRYRFIPAMAAGHRVRQLVRLPFRFDLHNH